MVPSESESTRRCRGTGPAGGSCSTAGRGGRRHTCATRNTKADRTPTAPIRIVSDVALGETPPGDRGNRTASLLSPRLGTTRTRRRPWKTPGPVCGDHPRRSRQNRCQARQIPSPRESRPACGRRPGGGRARGGATAAVTRLDQQVGRVDHVGREVRAVGGLPADPAARHARTIPWGGPPARLT